MAGACGRGRIDALIAACAGAGGAGRGADGRCRARACLAGRRCAAGRIRPGAPSVGCAATAGLDACARPRHPDTAGSPSMEDAWRGTGRYYGSGCASGGIGAGRAKRTGGVPCGVRCLSLFGAIRKRR